jgi:phosphonate transport system substrate-binding protein
VKTIRFGLSRSHAGGALVEKTRRFCAILSEQLALPVKSIVANDYEHLLEGVLVSGIDLGWMPPLLHARAVEHDALLAAVVQRSRTLTYRAAILVREDSDFQTLTDLRGARAAWTDRASASGYLFPKLHLLNAGVDDLDESLHGSVESALAAVRDGQADVCASFIGDKSALFPRLRVLALTDPIPPDGLVLAPGLDGKLQAQLRDRLLSLHADPAGHQAIVELFEAEKFVPVTAALGRAIDHVRALAKKHL